MFGTYFVDLVYPNEGGKGGLPPEWDVNLFIRHVDGRGVCGDVAVQGLILGSASVCLCVCVLVRTGFGGWSGSEFRGKDRTKRFRRTRSTFSSVEVGSDSLILIVWAPFCVGFTEEAPSWYRFPQTFYLRAIKSPTA